MQKLMQRRTFLWSAPALAGVWPAARAADRPLLFGVLNQQTPARTAQRWNPVFGYLSAKLAVDIQLRMGPSVRETNAMMARGEFDFVFTNHNFRPEYDGTYKVIARLAGKPIFGVIAVPADSPARRLRDLQGKRVAFPSREAFVAYAVPMQALRAAGVTVEEVMASSQDGVLGQLKSRAVDAAAVNSRFLTQYAAQNGLAYREIFTSEPYAEIPVLAHPRVPRELADDVRRVLVGMRTDPAGSAILEASAFAGFEPATEALYDNVRRVYRAQ